MTLCAQYPDSQSLEMEGMLRFDSEQTIRFQKQACFIPEQFVGLQWFFCLVAIGKCVIDVWLVAKAGHEILAQIAVAGVDDFADGIGAQGDWDDILFDPTLRTKRDDNDVCLDPFRYLGCKMRVIFSYVLSNLEEFVDNSGTGMLGEMIGDWLKVEYGVECFAIR